MLQSLSYFLADDVKFQQTQKRGGHLERVELNERSEMESFDYQQFDQAWAEVLFQRVLDTVKVEMIKKRGGEVWDQLSPFLSFSENSSSYEELANLLGVSVAGAKSEVHRLRKRFRETLRVEVGRTVSAPHEVSEEIAYLRSAIERMK